MPSPREVLQTFSAVVLTGGSSGIGKSFIQSGERLAPHLWFCNLSRRIPVINLPQLKLCHIPCDLARPAEIDAAATRLLDVLEREAPRGRILLINNSGFGSYGRFPEPNLTHQLEMLDVNLRGLVHLTGSLLPLLRERGGVVMNIASTAAYQPTPYMATYGATKTFLLHWTYALNQEWNGAGLRAMAICPGPTRTAFSQRAGLKPGTVENELSMSADEVVRQAYEALGSSRVAVVPGWRNKLSAALGGLAPRRLATAVADRIIGRYRASQVRPS